MFKYHFSLRYEPNHYILLLVILFRIVVLS